VLAVASLVTVGQRVHAVRSSPGAVDLIALPRPAAGDGEQ
jgi:CDP-diacylglycerol--glycerol-3-phosphate 3-phosphatidyltransferase